MKPFWAVLIALALSYATVAESRQVTIRGAGTGSCGKWLADHQAGRGPFLDSWLMGYVTATNEHLLTQSADVAEGTDLNGMVEWMNNHCRANPLDTIDKAAGALVLELLKRSKAF